MSLISDLFEVELFADAIPDDALKHLAEQLFGFFAGPLAALLVVVKVETTGLVGQPQLAQRLLAAEDQLAAVVELDGQDPCRVLHVQIQVRLIEQVFQGLLGRVDQVVKTRFGQTHCKNLKNVCTHASRARYERRAPNAKDNARQLAAAAPRPTAGHPHRQGARCSVYSGAILLITKDYAMKRLISTLAALVAVACLVSACGQKGPLYLPDDSKDGQKSQSHKHQ